MADSVDVKPKILSLSEIEGMVAKQEQLKQATPEMMYKSGHPGSMTRPSKLFIKVDREGLLTDTIAISDVVDFDCYESIVSSACRIISCFQCTKPENIEVETLFYYKKRARSTRMNPVTIRSTTDAFKAVAEHPVGEVPIGVRWNQKFKYKFMTNTDNTKALVPENGTQTSKETHVRIAPKPSEDTENVVPEKKRKLQEETQKTLVVQQSHDTLKAALVGPVDKSEPKTQIQHNAATSHISPFNQAYPVISSEAFKGNKTNVHPTIPGKVVPVQYAPRSKEDDADPPAEVEERSDRYIPRHTQDAQYMFPKGARSELVVTYGDGVVEKRKLPEEVLKVVNMMLKGNYTYLTKEAQTILSVGQNATPGEEKAEGKDFYPTGRTRSGVIEFENSRPIKYIKDAKSEIFRILSMLSVSKTRFKSLLKWLKTLKLEDGKKGKFFLSARDIIGGTKYVISSGFEENEEQVLKHDQTYKPYGPVTHGTGPSVADLGTRPVPAIPEPPHNQIMFLMPTSIANLPSNATPVFKTSTGVTVVPTSKVVHVPGQPKSQLILSSPNTSSKTTETVSSVSSTPPILRKHARKSSQPSRSRDASPNPIPMNLYRAYRNSDEDRSSPVDKSTDNDGCLTVKVEPHDYDSETSDTTVDYDRNSERDMISPRPGVHTDTFSGDHSAYTDSMSHEYDKRKVLRSDAVMPLSTEAERPLDIIIKSEPMDDYVCP